MAKPFFIALDSEGFTIESTNEHITVLLYASTGEYIQNVGGISTADILDFLIVLAKKYKKLNPHYIIYGASYDFNMFIRQIREIDAREINKKIQDDNIGYTDCLINDEWFLISTIPRKFLQIKKGDISIKIVDVIGFFQSSFIEAVRNWLPHVVNTADFQKMVNGKNNRTDFANWSMQDIIYYCKLELDYLIQIMDMLAKNIDDLGLEMKSYHGAGAIAKAMLDKHVGRGYISDKLPNPIESASRQAFFGGHIELMKYGGHHAKLYEADLNSAYPFSILDIVPTTKQKWHIRNWKNEPIKHIDNLQEFGLMKISWKCRANSSINPFAYRSKKQKKVFFPTEGIGTYHFCEIRAALKNAHKNGLEIIPIISYELITENEKIFKFVQHYYDFRQKIVSESKATGVPNGQEKIIKLGLNSIYGKICQTVGGKNRRPPYHNIFWAGYITAMTRASIYNAAMTDPNSIVMIATDGIYSTKKLKLDYSDKKEIGKWDHSEYDGGIFVQSGYYFLKKGNVWKAKTRGFDKLKTDEEINAQIEKISLFYEHNIKTTFFACTRFITLPTACTGQNFKKWCTWYEMQNGDTIGRALNLTPTGTKRDSIEKNPEPNLRLCKTLPIYNLTPDIESESYVRDWDEIESETIIDELLDDGYIE